MRFAKLTSYYEIAVVQYEIKRAEFAADDSPYLLHP